MALVSWSMDYASAKSLQGNAGPAHRDLWCLQSVDIKACSPVWWCNISVFFLSFLLHVLVSYPLQPTSGYMGSLRAMWRSSTSPGLLIPWSSSCSPRSSVTWFRRRPSVSSPSPVGCGIPSQHLCIISSGNQGQPHIYLLFWCRFLMITKSENLFSHDWFILIYWCNKVLENFQIYFVISLKHKLLFQLDKFHLWWSRAGSINHPHFRLQIPLSGPDLSF